MNKTIRLLVVEDDQTEVQSWRMQIDFRNATAAALSQPNILPVFVATKEDALREIANADFDAAVVDIGLATGAAHKEANSDGNDVVSALENSELAVVFVHTGQPNDVSKGSGARVRVISKGEGDGGGSGTILDLLKENAPMIFAVRSAEAAIKNEMAKLFSRSIWPRWKFWFDGDGEPGDAVAAAITRHLVSHVYSSLMHAGDHEVLPEEWYFIPPIGDSLGTGDLVELKHFIPGSTEIAVVVTPRCDLANNVGNKNEMFQLAVCQNIADDWAKKNEAVKRAIETRDKNLLDKVNELRRLTQHRSTSNFHFLPPIKKTDGVELGPFMVRFDQVHSFPRKVDGNPVPVPARLASISPEFLPSLVERLGAYFSRIGTPNYSFKER